MIEVEYAYVPIIEIQSKPRIQSKAQIKKKLQFQIDQFENLLKELPSEISKIKLRIQCLNYHKIHRDKDKGVFIVHYIDEKEPFEYDMKHFEVLGYGTNEEIARKHLESEMISLIEMYEKCFIYAPEKIQKLTDTLNSL